MLVLGILRPDLARLDPVILNSSMQRIRSQIGAVHLLGWQAVQLISHILAGYLHGLLQTHSLGHLCDHAGDGYGRGAAEGPKLDVFHLVLFYPDEYLHEISADGIAPAAAVPST